MHFLNPGCQTCKSRHIKCDKTEPACERCQKSGRTCRRVSSVIHIENSYASRQAKRPRGPRSNPTQVLTGGQLGPSRLLSVDLREQALAFYVRYHFRNELMEVPDLVRSQPDEFLPFWTSRGQCPMLDLSISSMALAVFSRTKSHPPAAIEAFRQYQQLLPIARREMATLNKKNLDVCLLANYFMSRYEDVVYRPDQDGSQVRPFFKTLQSISHHDGALAMLQTWKQLHSEDRPATDVIKHTRRGMIRSALLRNIALPDWILEGAAFGESGSELEYDTLNVRIALVRQRLSTLYDMDLSHSSCEFRKVVKELDRESQLIDRSLEEWANSFPVAWSYKMHDSLRRDSPFPKVYSYRSPVYAAIWNLYFVTRMLVNNTRVKVLQLRYRQDEYEDQEISECLYRIKDLTNHLTATLPFCLNQFYISDASDDSSAQGSAIFEEGKDVEPCMAGLIIWPLTVASSLAYVDIQRRTWFRSELARLGKLVSARNIECAMTDQWLEL